MTMRMRLQRSCDTNYDHRHKPSPITGHALVRHTCRVVPRTTLALLALAATLTAALPLAPIALIHAPAAIAKKPFPKLDRSTRAKSADRQLKRAHTHVIPDRAAPLRVTLHTQRHRPWPRPFAHRAQRRCRPFHFRR